MLCTFSQNAFSQIEEGGIMVIGFDAVGTDYFVMAILVEIPADEVIYIADKEWLGTSLDTNEGILTWTNDTGAAIPAGSIVTIEGDADGITPGMGSISETDSGFSFVSSGDEVHIYQGPDQYTPTSWITYFSSSQFDDGTLANTGLTHGVNAIDDQFFTDDDVLLYTGSLDCSGMTVTECATMMADVSSFAIEDPNNDGAFPNIPEHVPAASSFSPPNPTLPIALAWINARIVQDQKVEISWETTVEINNDYMRIDHMQKDGFFQEIERVEGQNLSVSSNTYQIIHSTPHIGDNYYRMVQLDLDGTKTISETVSVKVSGVSNVSIFPTSVRDQITITNSDYLENPLKVSIIDNFGRVCHSERLDSYTTEINMQNSSFPSGIYNLIVQGSDTVESFRIIKL